MRILETVLYAEDLAAAERFYTQTLGLEVVLFDVERGLFLKCDNGLLIIFKASKTVQPGAVVPQHGTTGEGHMAFAATDEELVAWDTRLRASGVTMEPPVTWENGAKSIYFRDPAGNVLEFVTPRLWGL